MKDQIEKLGEDPWGQASTFDDLCELNARFIEGSLRVHPANCAETVDEETEPLRETLAAFNRAGFLTTCSQPGCDESGVRQRAFVDGVAREEVASRIEALSLSTSLYVCVSRPREGHGCRTLVTFDGIEPIDEDTRTGDSGWSSYFDCWVGFEYFSSAIRPEAMTQLRDTYFVSVIDLEWGREGHLWRHLELALLQEKTAER